MVAERASVEAVGTGTSRYDTGARDIWFSGTFEIGLTLWRGRASNSVQLGWAWEHQDRTWTVNRSNGDYLPGTYPTLTDAVRALVERAR